MTRHVILGGNGIVGREAASALLATGDSVASVGRTESSVPKIDSVLADLRDGSAVHDAVSASDTVYLTVGLPYRTKTWRADWPTIMGNAIEACLAHDTHLVYFDNVYCYGRTDAPMTESTPIRPSSVKGQIRAELIHMLEAARPRGLRATIARSADFYGPGASASVFNDLAINKVAVGKEPTWLFDSSQPHSMTYTRDIGKALAILGTEERAIGRTWHLPTAAPALTGEDYLGLATGGTIRHRTMSMGTMRMGAIFMPVARGALELSYQNTAPYVFDSSLFESTFGMAPTPCAEGIARALAHARTAAGTPRAESA